MTCWLRVQPSLPPIIFEQRSIASNLFGYRVHGERMKKESHRRAALGANEESTRAKSSTKLSSEPLTRASLAENVARSNWMKDSKFVSDS